MSEIEGAGVLRIPVRISIRNTGQSFSCGCLLVMFIFTSLPTQTDSNAPPVRTRQRVVDVCGPDAGEEEQHLVRPHVHWHQEQPHEVRRGLEQAVDGVKRQSRKGGQRVAVVVDVLQRHTNKSVMQACICEL